MVSTSNLHNQRYFTDLPEFAFFKTLAWNQTIISKATIRLSKSLIRDSLERARKLTKLCAISNTQVISMLLPVTPTKHQPAQQTLANLAGSCWQQFRYFGEKQSTKHLWIVFLLPQLRMEAFFALEDINLRLIPFREGSVKFVCSIDWK